MLLIEIRFDQSNKHNTRNKNPDENLLEKVDDVCPRCPNKISLLPQLCEQCLSRCGIKRENGPMPIFTLTKESQKGDHIFTEPNMQPCTKSENPICNPSFWPNTAIPQSTKKTPYYKTPSIGHLFNCLRFTDDKNSANTQMLWNGEKTLTLSVLKDIQAGQEIICFRDQKYKQKYTITLETIVNAQDETLKRQCSAFQDENERLLKRLKRNTITMCQMHLKNKDLKEFFCEYVSDPTKFTQETGGCFEDLLEYGLEKTVPEGNVFNFHKRSQTFNDLIARRLLVQEEKTSLKNMCDMVLPRFTEINENVKAEFSSKEYLNFQNGIFQRTKKELQAYFEKKQNMNMNSKKLMDEALESLTQTILHERGIPDYVCFKYTITDDEAKKEIEEINISSIEDPLFTCYKCLDPKYGFRLHLKTYVCPLTGFEATEYNEEFSVVLCMECVQIISNDSYPIIKLPIATKGFNYMCITTSEECRYIISFLNERTFDNYKTASRFNYFYYLTPRNTDQYFPYIQRREHLDKVIESIKNLDKKIEQEEVESIRLSDAQAYYHFYLSYIENKKVLLSQEQWPAYKIAYFLNEARLCAWYDSYIQIAFHRYQTAHSSQSIDMMNASLLNFYYKQTGNIKCLSIHTFDSSKYMEEIHRADKFLARNKRNLFLFMIQMYYSTEYSPPTLQLVDQYNIKAINFYRVNNNKNNNENLTLLKTTSNYLTKRHTFMDELNNAIDFIRNQDVSLASLKKECEEDGLQHFDDWYFIMSNSVFIQEII